MLALVKQSSVRIMEEHIMVCASVHMDSLEADVKPLWVSKMQLCMYQDAV